MVEVLATGAACFFGETLEDDEGAGEVFEPLAAAALPGETLLVVEGPGAVLLC